LADFKILEMKKTFVFLLLFFSWTIGARSQEASISNGYIGISAGPCFPTGEFESSNIENDAAGFAKTGFHVDLSLTYKLGKNFGIAAMLRGTSHPFNKEAFYSFFNLLGFGGTYTLNADNWRTGSVLFGGYGSFPISKSRTTFDAKLLAGFANARFPALNLSYSFFGTSATSFSESKTDLSFQYLLAAGLQFYASDKIAVLADLDVSGASFEFANIKSTDDTGQESQFTKSQNVTLVTLSAGIAIKLK
jgi:hypothetical protein